MKNQLKEFWNWLTCKDMDILQAQIQLGFYMVNLVVSSFLIYIEANALFGASSDNLYGDVPMFVIWLILFLLAYKNLSPKK